MTHIEFIEHPNELLVKQLIEMVMNHPGLIKAAERHADKASGIELWSLERREEEEDSDTLKYYWMEYVRFQVGILLRVVDHMNNTDQL